MPATEERIVTLEALRKLADEKPVRKKRVYIRTTYGNFTPVIRVDSNELSDLHELIVRVKGEDAQPEDVGLHEFAVVQRIATKQLAPETVVFLPGVK